MPPELLRLLLHFHRFLLLHGGDGHAHASALASRRARARIYNNGETLKHLLLNGVGIGRLALWHVAAEFKAGRLVPLLEKYNPGDLEQIHAVHVGGGQVPHRVRAFIRHMVDTMKASPLPG
ncbi:LysR substrate-binding domain-containing protein [Archangium sp. Cb G35]|uniref:LysR substrate-binding domain-containing protein n=1 Tax=Archangium sp. Cb G35 TaxID=1920190 RepID=UPI001E537FA4|nr:LysR substrate-binding domain-containing protein [Archangium sp. Cb G35]